MARSRTGRGAEPQRILDAAIDALAKYGYAGCSMQRVADCAQVDKRMLPYYFRDRSGLFSQVTDRVGDRLLDELEEAVGGLAVPDAIVAAGFDALWHSVVSEPRLHAAYLGLVSASVTEPSLRPQVARIRERYARLVLDLAARAEAAGFSVRLAEPALVGLTLAGIHGLTMDYLQRGETPGLTASIAEFKLWLTQLAVRPTPAALIDPG